LGGEKERRESSTQKEADVVLISCEEWRKKERIKELLGEKKRLSSLLSSPIFSQEGKKGIDPSAGRGRNKMQTSVQAQKEKSAPSLLKKKKS